MIQFTPFMLTSIVLILTPGNDTIFILSRSIALGTKAGIISTFGIATGVVVHTLLAAFGLSVIVASSPSLFSLFKYAGAVYLIYIGWSMIKSLSPDFGSISGNISTISSARIYRDAAVTNMLNPKVSLFFMALLPQFVDPAYQDSLMPYFLLGFIHGVNAIIWFTFLATFSGAMSSRLKQKERISAYIQKTCGGILMILGVRLALEG